METNQILKIATRLTAGEKPNNSTSKEFEKAYYHPMKERLIDSAKRYMNHSAETDINKKETEGELASLERQLKGVWTEIDAK